MLLLLFSGSLPNQDKSVGKICLELEFLISLISTSALYKQLGEVGGVLELTSQRQFYLHSTSAEKFPESPLPCHCFNRKQGADHRSHSANTGCQLQQEDHHMHSLVSAYARQHRLPHMLWCSFTLNFLTFPHTLICTSSLSSHPLPLLWMWPCSADNLFSFSHSFYSSNCFCRSLFTSPTPALTTSTKLTPQARSVESVGGVRCWHFPPPMHWAQLQDWTACLLAVALVCFWSDQPPTRVVEGTDSLLSTVQPPTNQIYTSQGAAFSCRGQKLYCRSCFWR